MSSSALCECCGKQASAVRVTVQQTRVLRVCRACVPLYKGGAIDERVRKKLCSSCQLSKATKKVGLTDPATAVRTVVNVCDHCVKNIGSSSSSAPPLSSSSSSSSSSGSASPRLCDHCHSRAAANAVTSSTGERFAVCALCTPVFKKKLQEAAVLAAATGRSTMYMPSPAAPTPIPAAKPSAVRPRDARRATTTGVALTKSASASLTPKTAKLAAALCDECHKDTATARVEFDGNRRAVCAKCAARFRALSDALSFDSKRAPPPAAAAAAAVAAAPVRQQYAAPPAAPAVAAKRAVSHYDLAPAPVLPRPAKDRPAAALPAQYGEPPPEIEVDSEPLPYVPLAAPGITVLSTTDLSDSDESDDLVIAIGKVRVPTLDSIAAIEALEEEE